MFLAKGAQQSSFGTNISDKMQTAPYSPLTLSNMRAGLWIVSIVSVPLQGFLVYLKNLPLFEYAIVPASLLTSRKPHSASVSPSGAPLQQAPPSSVTQLMSLPKEH